MAETTSDRPAAGGPPNIVLIVSDDHGFGDLGFRGVEDDVSTPHLDALAADGRVYDNAYVTAPICSPSRAGLITGAHQARWGAHWFTDSAMAPESVPSLPERLAARGYRTGYFGKVHYGADEEGSRACPPHHGFETSFYGLAAQSMGRLHYLHHTRAHEEAYGEAARRHGVSPMWEGEERVDCERHLTEEFVQRAIDFVDAPDERPFFSMIAFNAVHNFTWQLPQHELDARGLPAHPDFDAETNDYLDWYDGAVEPNLDNGREYYLAQLEIMDREIGRLRAHLERQGLAENTIVVYMTDNGGSRCNYGRNTPLEGSKYTLYDGGVRTPMLISWPGVIAPGSVSKALVSSLDLTRGTAAPEPRRRRRPATGSTCGDPSRTPRPRSTTCSTSTRTSSGRSGRPSGSCATWIPSPGHGGASSRSSTPTSARACGSAPRRRGSPAWTRPSTSPRSARRSSRSSPRCTTAGSPRCGAARTS
jgi:arylsulfatase A-like enzyme